MPERRVLGLARRDGGILDDAGLESRFQHLFHLLAQIELGIGRGQLDQGIGGMVALQADEWRRGHA